MGLQGPQGIQGPAGPAGRGEGQAVLDINGARVGSVVNFASGLVLRNIDGDRVVMPVSVSGFTQAPISFMHASDDCSGPRYLVNWNGPAFAFFGQVMGTQVVYTREVDPMSTNTTAVNSMETVSSPAELATTGSCMPTPGFVQSVGTVVVADDPGMATLAAPFRIE